MRLLKLTGALLITSNILFAQMGMGGMDASAMSGSMSNMNSQTQDNAIHSEDNIIGAQRIDTSESDVMKTQDNIGVMSDRILFTEGEIGTMSDRILTTQKLQNGNVDKTEDTGTNNNLGTQNNAGNTINNTQKNGGNTLNKF